MYETDDAFKVNEVIEVVGVLSRLPELAIVPDSSSEDVDIFEYDSVWLPPTSQVKHHWPWSCTA